MVQSYVEGYFPKIVLKYFSDCEKKICSNSINKAESVVSIFLKVFVVAAFALTAALFTPEMQ